jgi:hypothetical protein
MQGDEILRLQTSTQQEGSTRETIFGTFWSENVQLVHPPTAPSVTNRFHWRSTPMLLMSTSRTRALFAHSLNRLRDRLFVELESLPVVGLDKSFNPTLFL